MSDAELIPQEEHVFLNENTPATELDFYRIAFKIAMRMTLTLPKGGEYSTAVYVRSLWSVYAATLTQEERQRFKELWEKEFPHYTLVLHSHLFNGDCKEVIYEAPKPLPPPPASIG